MEELERNKAQLLSEGKNPYVVFKQRQLDK
jgi:hypothetical protein